MAVGITLDAHDALRVEFQEAVQLEHDAIGAELQLGAATVEQHIAQTHHQTALGLGGSQRNQLLLERAALLQAEQLGLAQGQLQALALQPQALQLLLFRRLHAVLTGNRPVTLAQVGVVRNIFLAAPVVGQALRTRQGVAGASHILGRGGQHCRVAGERLVAAAGLRQGLLRVRVGGGTAGQQDNDAQPQRAKDGWVHCRSPSWVRRRTMLLFSSVSCARVLPVRVCASTSRASSSARSASMRALR
ncbi:hypothetical protein D3C81_1161760 [compost metagenome]